MTNQAFQTSATGPYPTLIKIPPSKNSNPTLKKKYWKMSIKFPLMGLLKAKNLQFFQCLFMGFGFWSPNHS